jgi:hypothetical protein
MFTAYIVVTLLAAVANAFSATLDFIRFKQILINMAPRREQRDASGSRAGLKIESARDYAFFCGFA